MKYFLWLKKEELKNWASKNINIYQGLIVVYGIIIYKLFRHFSDPKSTTQIDCVFAGIVFGIIATMLSYLMVYVFQSFIGLIKDNITLSKVMIAKERYAKVNKCTCGGDLIFTKDIYGGEVRCKTCNARNY